MGRFSALIPPFHGAARKAFARAWGGWLVAALLLASSHSGQARSLRATDVTIPRGQSNCISMVFTSDGNEIALSWSVCFDTNLLSFVSARRGPDASGTSFFVNTNQLPRGRIGLTLTLPGGGSFPAGDNAIVELCFRSATGGGIVSTPMTICDLPVAREILDMDGGSVVADYGNGQVTLIGGCNYQLSTNAASFNSGGGASAVMLTADPGCSWSALSQVGWITLNSAPTGSGSAAVGFDVAMNPEYVGRTGVVVIAGQTFTVTQAAVPCSFRLNLTERVHGPASEFNFVEITASSDCRWSALNTNSWITITSGSSGSGNGRVDYWVAPNQGGLARTGIVTIAGLTFTVRQLGYPCTYTLFPEGRVHGPASEAAILNVNAPDGCAWYVVNTNDWMIIKLYTNGVGNDIVRYTVFANPHPFVRSGVLTIGGKPFTVTQIGAPCVYSLLQSNQLYGPGPAADNFSVATLAECSWTATTTNNWIVISTPNGTGGGQVSFYVAPNWTSTDRKGYIQIADKTFVVTQLGTPCRFTISPTSRSISAGSTTGQVSVSTSVTGGTGTSNQTCHWTALNTSSWIQVYQALDPTNKGIVSYSVAANTVGAARTAVLVVAGQSFTISQAGLPCTYAVSPTSRSHGYNVETGVVTVTSVTGCPWTPTTADPWIFINNPASGAGSGSFGYRVAPNAGPARTGRITVGSAVYTVSQTAAAPVTFASQPQSRQVAAGANVSFSVSVSGVAPFTYQWLFNGSDLQDGPTVSGVFTPTLTIQNVQPENAGTYSVRVSNLRGPVQSAPAQLTVNTAPQLNPIPDRSTVRGNPVTFTATARDLQSPPQRLTYSLAPGAPSGSSINATSGVFTWTPPGSQPIGGFPITVHVTDNGVPPLSDDTTTTISVFPGYSTNVSLIATGSIWKYRDTGEDLGTAWTAPGFDDSLWLAGPGRLGYGNGDETTTVGFGPNAAAKYVTTYFRTRFSVSDPSVFSFLSLRLLRDDGAVVYLNGVEVFRDNMPAGPINSQTLASTKIGATLEYSYLTAPPVDPAGLIARDNVVAVEIHQNTVGSSDIEFDLELTGRVTVQTAFAGFTPSASASPRVEIGMDPEGVVTLAWDTVPAARYRVEYTTDMTAPTWIGLSNEVIATNYRVQVEDAVVDGPQRFYRVVTLP